MAPSSKAEVVNVISGLVDCAWLSETTSPNKAKVSSIFFMSINIGVQIVYIYNLMVCHDKDCNFSTKYETGEMLLFNRRYSLPFFYNIKNGIRIKFISRSDERRVGKKCLSTCN